MGRTSNAKERLLTSALELVCKRSYGAVTIDGICENAGVRKGSFYYFFDSKAALTAAALHECWYSCSQKIWDEIFSASGPAITRIVRFMEFAYETQVVTLKNHGQVIGSPWFSVGSETCSQNEVVREKAREILGRQLLYFESAVRDAQAEGDTAPGNVGDKARCLFALVEGSMAQARIHNDPSYLRSLPEAAVAILSQKQTLPSKPESNPTYAADTPAAAPDDR